MFTGLIEEVGTITDVRKGSVSGTLRIKAGKLLEGVGIGDSIAVNGVCLTVTRMEGDTFTADVMAETFRRSTLGSLKADSPVNLERAMPAYGRFGGHIVSGHIDGTGTVFEIVREENAIWYTIRTDGRLLKYIVEKGSIAIDGISLTVAGVGKEDFKVSVIPHTAEKTIMKTRKKGDVVNLECDIIGKYVEKMLYGGKNEPEGNASGITLEFLQKNGF